MFCSQEDDMSEAKKEVIKMIDANKVDDAIAALEGAWKLKFSLQCYWNKTFILFCCKCNLKSVMEKVKAQPAEASASAEMEDELGMANGKQKFTQSQS